jgi:hypothetical protein
VLQQATVSEILNDRKTFCTQKAAYSTHKVCNRVGPCPVLSAQSIAVEMHSRQHLVTLTLQNDPINGGRNAQLPASGDMTHYRTTLNQLPMMPTQL